MSAVCTIAGILLAIALMGVIQAVDSHAHVRRHGPKRSEPRPPP